MIRSSASPLPEPQLLPRVLGRVRGEEPGPTLICVGGLHGNEPAGVEAIRRVFRDLEHGDVSLRGEFVGLTGNRPALARRRRFLELDMNRIWYSEAGPTVLGLPAGPSAEPGGAGGRQPEREPVESRERRELQEAIAEAADGARGPVFVLDLHTTSGGGSPFTAVGDTLANRALARSIPVPLVLGLEELVDGTFLEFLDDKGYISAVYESGQHDEPESIYRAEAGIWLALAHAGLLSDRALPRVRAAHRYLRGSSVRLPEVVEMRYRQHVEEGAPFTMRSGYLNFQPISEGEPLADEGGRTIRAPLDGRILMPLYQEQGNDGFFVVRAFHPFWLGVSASMRRLRLGRMLNWLPGVSFHEGRRHVVEIDQRVARIYALQFFHLLGYRKQREEHGRLFMIRRAYDVGD